jgi:hypothetical protein
MTNTANVQMSLIGWEARSGARLLGRASREQGYDVRLIAAQFAKPFGIAIGLWADRLVSRAAFAGHRTSL